MSPNKVSTFTSRKKVWQMSILVTSFVILTGGMIALNFTNTIPRTPYLFISALIVLFLIILFFSLLTMLVRYSVSSDGITLRSPLYREFIPFDSLKTLRLLTGEEAQELWKSLMTGAMDVSVGARNTGDITGYLRSGRKYKYLTRFCTIMPAQFTAGFNDNARVIRHKIFISGAFLLLTDISERNFLLTPKNPEGLLEEVSRYRR